MDCKQLKKQTEDVCLHNFGCSLRDASEIEAYRAVCLTVRELLVKKNHDFRHSEEQKTAKRVYYMSMEFLDQTDG